MSESPLIRDSLDTDEFIDSTVIDCDVHITYTERLQEEVAGRMRKPWADYENPVEVSASRYRRPSPGLPKSLGGKKEFEIANADTADIIYEHLCEGLGIDYPVLNVLSRADQIWNTDWATETIRGINTVLLDEFLDEYDNFYGAGTISFRDPARAAEEVDRLGNEDQMVAAMIFSGTGYQKPPGDPQYDIVYEALEDNDITPMFHVSGFNSSAPWLKKYETAMAWHTLGPPWSVQQAVVSLIAQGTPEKFPDLDFAIIEGGLGWVPFMFSRLNREYAQWRPEVSILEKSPEEYLRDQFYFSSQPMGEFNDPQRMEKLLEVIGTEMLMFATDYPHYDFDNPSTTYRFLSGLSTEKRNEVLHGNAAEAFGIDI